MNHLPFCRSASSAPARIPQRLTLILDALSRAAAARASRNWAAAPLVVLLWSYLHRLAARFASLAARVRAGRVVVRSSRPQTARIPTSRLPHGFAWLLRLVPEAVSFRSQLLHLLADPHMAALIAAAPQAARMLRPLCRMLGLSPGPELPPALFGPRPASVSCSAEPQPPPEPSARLLHPGVDPAPA